MDRRNIIYDHMDIGMRNLIDHKLFKNAKSAFFSIGNKDGRHHQTLFNMTLGL